MKPLTDRQRSGQVAAAWVVIALGAAAIVTGILVAATNPFGVGYGATGVLAGLATLGIGVAVLLAARHAPAA